jgi:hypothetical protein
MTDAPDAVQQLIAKWHDWNRTSMTPLTCADDLAHLHQTVLLPAIQALRDILLSFDAMESCDHDTVESELCLLCAGREALAALYAPAGGEGKSK